MSQNQSILQGALRFAAVSVAAFALWAFGGRALGSPAVLYSAIAAAFVILSGLGLAPLLGGEKSGRLARFYAIFVPGFLLYAALWCASWFGLSGQASVAERELLGSAAGLAAFALVITTALKTRGAFLPVLGVLFFFHTLGYTLGGLCYYAVYGKNFLAPLLEGQTAIGRLLWGLFYGLGFGAGLGNAFHRCRPAADETS